MQQVISPYVSAGVALVGSSIVVVTPVASPLPDLPGIQSPAVQLTAGEESFPWLTEVGSDLKTLTNNFLLAPYVDVQQLIANVANISGATNPPSIGDELQTALAAITLQQGKLSDTAFTDVVNAASAHTLTGGLGHSLFINPGILDLFLQPDQVAGVLPILHFLASPLSGVLMGMVSPFLAPIGALQDSLTRIFQDIQLPGDGPLHALEDLIKLPLNMIGSVFTGSTLNLDFLTDAINNSGALPEGDSITGLSIALGGLFSPGDVAAGNDGVYTDISGGTVPVLGGSILNSLGIDIQDPILPLNIAGEPVGPIGAILGLEQAVGAALGMDWDGKNAVAKAPLLGLDPFDDSGLKELFGGATAPASGAAADGLGQALTDLLDGNWSNLFSDVF